MKGVVQTEREARGLNAVKKDVQQLNPGTKYFLNPSGKEWATGDLLIQKDLGKVLKRIQKKGREGFYAGKTAKRLVKTLIKTMRELLPDKTWPTTKHSGAKPLLNPIKNTK
jgi:gamma-glutamyltranspeptidase/glutathione hydrolase